jgi:hypothetical protein
VKTHSYNRATPAEGKFPVIFYSPSGDLIQNTTLFQELASEGYVIFSVGHPYWNAFYYDEHGNVVPGNNKHPYYQALWNEETSGEANQTKEKITTTIDLELKKEAHRILNRFMPRETADIRLWAGDLAFLLDQLENPSENQTWLLGHIESNLVGVMGFSKGGAAAGQFCIVDKRVSAGINLSGFMFGDVVEEPIAKPFMILENMEEWCENCPPICDLIYNTARRDAYMVRIEGARHGNFSDWSLVGKFLQLIGITGPIEGERILEIQNRYVVAFFDRYLKQMEPILLKSPNPLFPEVKFDSRNANHQLVYELNGW